MTQAQEQKPLLTLTELTGFSKYPTKEEILENIYEPSTAEIEAVTRWKQTYLKDWPNIPTANKHLRLQTLIAELNIVARGNYVKYQTSDHDWCYIPDEQTINGQEQNPSIVSALHELGHHLQGASELLACTYSIGIYSTCFAETYKKLEWRGHMLIRPSQ